MPYILRTAYLIPDEALPRKGFQLLRTLQTVLDNKTRHLSATHLGIDIDSLRLSGLPNLKLGRNNTHLLLHPLPVEQIFHFSTCQINENTATVLNFLYEVIRQQRLPIIKHGYSTFFGQTDISIQTIGFDTVQRAKQPIKKRSDTQIFLRITKILR